MDTQTVNRVDFVMERVEHFADLHTELTRDPRVVNFIHSSDKERQRMEDSIQKLWRKKRWKSRQ